MTVENVSRSISTKGCRRPGGGRTHNLLITSQTGIQLSHQDLPVWTAYPLTIAGLNFEPAPFDVNSCGYRTHAIIQAHKSVNE